MWRCPSLASIAGSMAGQLGDYRDPMLYLSPGHVSTVLSCSEGALGSSPASFNFASNMIVADQTAQMGVLLSLFLHGQSLFRS